MKRNKLASVAALAAAMVMAVSAVPAGEILPENSFSITASAETVSEYTWRLPGRINGNGSIKVTPAGSGRLRLSWSGSKSKTYGVYLGYDAQPYIIKGTSVTLEGLTDGEMYDIYVYEMNKTSGSYEKADEYTCFYASDSPTSMTKIKNLKSKVKGGTAQFKWDPVQGAEKYAVYVGDTLYKTVSQPSVKVKGCPAGLLDMTIVPVRNTGKNIEYGIHTKVFKSFGAGGRVTAAKYEKDNQEIKYNGRVLFDFDAVYPVLTFEDSSVGKKINNEIQSFVYDDEVTKKLNRSEAELADYYNEISEYSSLGNGGDEASRRCEVAANTNKYICISSYGYEYYYGAAHGYGAVTYMNFDAKTGERLKFSDVFDTAKFEKKCFPIMAKNITDHRGMDTPADNMFITDSNWYYNNGVLTITYNPYEMGSYAEGMISTELTYDEIKDCLNSYGKELFGK